MIPRVLVLVFFVPFSLSAAAQLPRNEIAVAAGWTDLASLGGDRAIGASYNRFWTPMISTQLGAIRTSHFNDVHATAAFHPFREHFLSPWAALGIARVALDETPERSDSKLTTIAGAGVDVTISRQLAIGAQLHYSPFVVAPRERFGFNVNPMTVMVAARWRY